jgi:hypothetical protein
MRGSGHTPPNRVAAGLERAAMHGGMINRQPSLGHHFFGKAQAHSITSSGKRRRLNMRFRPEFGGTQHSADAATVYVKAVSSAQKRSDFEIKQILNFIRSA